MPALPLLIIMKSVIAFLVKWLLIFAVASVMIFGVSTACTVRLAALMVLELLRSRSPWIIAVLATFCAA